MKHFSVRNVNEALAQSFPYMTGEGIRDTSRNGDVIVAPGPVITEYARPTERVLFSPLRNANPFFHLMEALWLLAGRRDIEFPTYFNQRFRDFSDDGKIDHGSYGYRWRRWFGMDQLELLLAELKKNPNTRRAVLSMWAPQGDLTPIGYTGGLTSKDVPCNTHVYFSIRDAKLDMTVCCRSNDLLWGALGANVVHFSILQEYMAHGLQIPVGRYYQFSNNYHFYTSVVSVEAGLEMSEDARKTDLYSQGLVISCPLISTTIREWQSDLNLFMDDPTGDDKYIDPFFEKVAAPMYAAWYDRKNGGTGLTAASQIAAPDWGWACRAWIQRAEERKVGKQP